MTEGKPKFARSAWNQQNIHFNGTLILIVAKSYIDSAIWWRKVSFLLFFCKFSINYNVFGCFMYWPFICKWPRHETTKNIL